MLWASSGLPLIPAFILFLCAAAHLDSWRGVYFLLASIGCFLLFLLVFFVMDWLKYPKDPN